MEYSICLDGVENARELGGYKIGDKYIKKGVFLRTGKLTGATADAKNTLRNDYHLRHIVDLRMSMETAAVPDPEIPGSCYHHLPAAEFEDLPGFSPEYMELFRQYQRDRMKLFELSYESGGFDDYLYLSFLLNDKGKKAYKEFFRLINELENDESILWHCTDGKDRTGCASMLLLYALGADKELVIKDYLLTNEYNRKKIERSEQIASNMNMSPEKKEIFLFFAGGVIDRFMLNAIEKLEKEYGSVMGYIIEELGVTAAEIKELQNRYLRLVKGKNDYVQLS